MMKAGVFVRIGTTIRVFLFISSTLLKRRFLVISAFLFCASMPALAAFTIDYKRAERFIGQDIQVLFLNGTAEQQKSVMFAANKWTEWANINFVYHALSDSPPIVQSHIRVKIDPQLRHASGYSQIGIGNLSSSTEPTMVLVDTKFNLVAHEFGHAIGLQHEHQHPDRREHDYTKACSDMSWWTCYYNVKRKFTKDQNFQGTPPDKYSVMIYSEFVGFGDYAATDDRIKNRAVLDAQLSLFDKWAAAMIYPGKIRTSEKIGQVALSGQKFDAINVLSQEETSQLYQPDLSFEKQQILSINKYIESSGSDHQLVDIDFSCIQPGFFRLMLLKTKLAVSDCGGLESFNQQILKYFQSYLKPWGLN